MKRTIMILMILALTAGAAFGQTAVTGVTPKDARSMGMGGTFRVFSDGYSSFFGNPAGFAGMGSLTLLDTSVWAYIKPNSASIGDIQTVADSNSTDSQKASAISDLLAQNNNFTGAGTAIGLGWAGRGFALGANIVLDAPVGGSFPLGTKLAVVSQADGVVGFGIPIKLGILGLKLGLDGRAFYRIQSDPPAGWPLKTFMDAMNAGDLSAFDLYGGYGFAADAGAVLNIGPVLLGFSARDFGLEFKMGKFTAEDLKSNGFGALPFNGTTPYVLTPQYAAGLGLRLFENKKFEPSVYAEVENPQDIFASSDMMAQMFNSLHAGAQLRLLNFITVRGGLNKGWYSLGAGIDLSLIELDAAVFTEEMGSYPGSKGRTGISVQAAVRFGR